MENKLNLFSEFTAAMRTVITTRSPFPDVSCYISPVALPTCRNYSSYLPARPAVGEVKDYLEQQVLILKFNNPEHTPVMVKSYINYRLAFWKGNDTLKKDTYYLNDLLNLIIENCFDGSSSIPIRSIDETIYWYSDKITEMSGEGNQSSDRTKAKQKARYAIMSGGTRDDLRGASLDYRCDNFDILPTVKALVDKTPYSKNTVAKHGEGFYISQTDNTGQRVQTAKEVYPECTQQEISDRLDLSLITIKRYWRSKEEVEVV